MDTNTNNFVIFVCPRNSTKLHLKVSLSNVLFLLFSLLPLQRPSTNVPLQSKEEHFYQIIDALSNNAVRLMSECHARNSHLEDAGEVEKVIDCAYDIARAAKQLIIVLSDASERKG